MPQNTQDIIKALESANENTVSKMLWDLIKTHKLKEGGEQQKLYARYEQTHEGVPIYKKQFQNYEKVTERIPNDFFGDIIDLKTGYMGNEIIIEIDKKAVPDETDRVKEDEFLRAFMKRESLVDENSELVKMAATVGKAYRLLFVSSEDGDAKVMNVDPWEAILFKDGSITTPTIGMRYYYVEEIELNETNEAKRENRYRVEWYDETTVTYYRENKSGIFELDTTKPAGGDFVGTGKQPHFFDGVPLIEFPNNREDKGEAAKVLELIDAYDDIISDTTSEVEQLRMAYLWAKGAGLLLDGKFQEALEQTGVFPLPQDGEVGFISKNLGGAGTFVKTVLDEIRRNIYSFSKSIDLSEDKGGGTRVIGWQIALLRLEMSAQVTERKFVKSYLRQYEMLTTFWGTMKSGIVIDPLDLTFVFTRKFPKDIDQEIDMLVKGIDVLPLEKLYSLATFIDDPITLSEQFREEHPGVDSLIEDIEDAEAGLDSEEGEGTAGVDGSVQNTALNGAQIASLLEIVQEVAMGTLTKGTAKPMIESAFPFMPESQIDEMLNNIKPIKQLRNAEPKLD